MAKPCPRVVNPTKKPPVGICHTLKSIIFYSCNMDMSDLPEIYAQSPRA